MGKRKSNKGNKGNKGTGNINKMINKVNRDYMTKIETLSLEVGDELFDECLELALENVKPMEKAVNILYDYIEENNFEAMSSDSFAIVANAFNSRVDYICSKELQSSIKKKIVDKLFSTIVKREAEQLMDKYAEAMSSIPMSQDRLSKEIYKIEYSIRVRALKMMNIVLGDVFTVFESYAQTLCLAMNEFMNKYVVDEDEEIVEIEEIVETKEDEVHIMKVTDRKELIDLAQDNGYVFKSQKGSHMKFENEDGKVVIIPMHNGDCGTGLSHVIQKQIFNK
jgi:predicted RNA binding protein YcfA (HicA-like mRNA interferase family)